ncbi:MAG: nucleotidyltransferase family protein [Bacteroidales bacterium]|nr:nucleotidyltransferase family protein [Bacteroidales bacterium]
MNSLDNRGLFLHLLARAVWDKSVEGELFENLKLEDWREIVNMARKQSVSALVADKALSLPKAYLPPRDMSLLFLTQIEQTRNLNRKIIHTLSVVTEEYREEDIPFVLLKGPSSAANYPDPYLRNPGDLDLFIYRKEDYARSKERVRSKGFEFEVADTMHYHYSLDGVNIEPHHKITYFERKRYEKRFVALVREAVNNESFKHIDIEGVRVKQLPVEMHALYLFHHMFRHFAHQGVGFRQFCDWLLFLKKHRNEIDKDSFTALAKSYALLFPMQVFARAAVKYLEASESIFPFDMTSNERLAEAVVEDIFESGNFGFHGDMKKRPKENIRGLWFSYTFTLKRTLKFCTLSPEHILLLPYWKLITRLRIGFASRIDNNK